MDDGNGASLFDTERNCWRVARANRVGLIVDAAEYFGHLRRALMAARHQVLLVGWDFDFEIEMLPGESDADGMAPDGLPNLLGPFIEAVVDRAPDLDLHMVKWNGALLLAPGRIAPSFAMQVWSNDRIHFALDGHHPFGACHHQKIVVVDDALAFCGGIDATEDRWDTSEHAPGDPRRIRKDGTGCQPWHDATSALDGDAAAALGELARQRWLRATEETLEAPSGLAADDLWPDALPVAVRDVDVAIARTEPPYDGANFVDEIERLSLDAIASARRWIYIESQYFSCASVMDAIEARLREPGGPEVVALNPQSAITVLEDRAMHALRGREIERLRTADAEDRFRIWYPVNAAEEPIYVHAKVMIVDDRFLKLGSSNLDDRSMGFDTECDVAFEGRDEATRAAILAFRDRLAAEHLGVSPERVAQEMERTGSIVATMDGLNRPRGRGLRVMRRLPESVLARILADSRLFDPRYDRGERTRAGLGIRPRHLALAALAVAGLGAAWWAWRRR